LRVRLKGKFVLGIAGVMLLSGCIRHWNKNPPAITQVGYVDFYCESQSDLSWDVLRFDSASGKMKPAYSKYFHEDASENKLTLSSLRQDGDGDKTV